MDDGYGRTGFYRSDPRSILELDALHVSKSLARVIRKGTYEVRVDHDFEAVIRACSQSPRIGQSGTWIVPDMVKAYLALHRAGHAHSVETWIDGQLAGGLYCVGLGRAVFGESMFTRRPDASKIALAALVCLCRRSRVQMIDCQQNTSHLASLGAREMSRASFVAHVAKAREQQGPQWHFEPVYWTELLSTRPSEST